MTAIYHITHLNNLPAIIHEGGIWCDERLAARGLGHVNIAYQHIKDRRARKQVPCAAGGTLADYVPFYFAPRSPMLYVINRGLVEGYSDGQGPIVHLVSSAEAVAAAGLSYAFTDGHADVAISHFYADLGHLGEVDWNIMTSVYWNDTNADGDRKRRRQAEFLVHQFFPWHLIESISVMKQSMALQVAALLPPLPQPPPINVEPRWYY